MGDDILAKLAVPVDAGDPSVNIMSLVEVTKNICEATGKNPVEGVMMLMTSAAWLLYADVAGMAKASGRDLDIPHLIQTYMQMAAYGWNANGFIFRGLPADEPEIGECTTRDCLDDETPDPDDRTKWN